MMKKIGIALGLLLGVCAIAFFSLNSSGAKKRVYFYTWSEYIPDSVFDKFYQETGIKVIINSYDTANALYSKMKITGGKGYDLLLLSMDFFDLLIKDKIVTPWNVQEIPNFKNIDPQFLRSDWRSDDYYFIPLAWGSTSFVVNTNKVKNFTSIQDLFRPELKGRILLANDPKSTIGMALRLLGYPLNSRNEQEINEAYLKLRELWPSVKGLETENAAPALLNGEVDVAVTWNGVAELLHRTNPEFVYVYPSEGTPIWADGLALLTQSQNRENAVALVNFLLRPEIAKEIIDAYPYATTNKETYALLEDSVKNSPIIYPKNIPHPEYERSFGEMADLYLEYWNKLRMESSF